MMRFLSSLSISIVLHSLALQRRENAARKKAPLHQPGTVGFALFRWKRAKGAGPGLEAPGAPVFLCSAGDAYGLLEKVPSLWRNLLYQKNLPISWKEANLGWTPISIDAYQAVVIRIGDHNAAIGQGRR